jgi:lantibiotic modifying enzyme
MNEKTITFSVNTFRNRKEENERVEFTTFSSYSENLETAMNELSDYLHFANNKFQDLYILMCEGKDIIWQLNFHSDLEFYDFKAKVKDARIKDYKEWLLSNYQNGAT